MARGGRALVAVAVLAALLGALAAVGVSGAATAVSGAPDTLSAGATLSSGQQLQSPDGHFSLVMQSDGNLVDYAAGGHVLWSTGTSGATGARAVLQTNGDLVLLGPSNDVVWSSNSRTSGCPQLVLQDDGNPVVYAPRAIWAPHAIQSSLLPGEMLEPGWSIYSSSPEDYRLTMQTDGNLVLYDGAGVALWSSRTHGHPGADAVMQTDGNLVVYASGHHALWASGTQKHPGAYLVAQGDGNLVVYLGTKALWASQTHRAAGGVSAGPRPPAPASCPVPTTPTTTPPSPPVVTTPVTTPVPTTPPVTIRALRVRLRISWTWNRSVTLLRGTRIGHFPGRTELVVRCRGRGCPRRDVMTAAGPRRLRRLLQRLAGHRYRAGDRLLITLLAPGYRPERAEVDIRWGRVPRIRLL